MKFNFFSYLGPAISMWLSQQATFRIGNKRLTFSEGGSAVHLTIGAIVWGLGMVAAGQNGTFQSGVVTLQISDWSPDVALAPAPPPTTVSAATPQQTDVPVGKVPL